MSGTSQDEYNYPHALILLGMPEEDRAQFISDIDIESMTTRELEQAVNELKQSELEKAFKENITQAELKLYLSGLQGKIKIKAREEKVMDNARKTEKVIISLITEEPAE